WYYITTNATNLTLRTAPGAGFSMTTNVQPVITPDKIIPALISVTPGARNTGATNINPAIPPLWLNEIEPDNLDAITDHLGAHEPWLELYNAGTNAVALDGFSLADNYTNLTEWIFPSGATIAPGEFKIIFVDGNPGKSTPAEWHTSFRLASGTGAIA